MLAASQIPASQADDDPVLQMAGVLLRKHFGHRALHKFQRQAISSWAENKDALVVIATGAGKSACFQLPPLCTSDDRWVLVVSPLISLMRDQVQLLKARKISATFMGTAQRDPAAAWRDIKAKKFKLVYVSPEYALANLSSWEGLCNDICLLAVDEAHCVSSWGHDFRPQYRELLKLRNVLQGVPVMCFTATASPQVREDIEKNLKLGPNLTRVTATMNRPNLKYDIRPRQTQEKDLGILFECPSLGSAEARRARNIDNTIIGPTSSSLIYVHTKAKCEEIADWLSERGVLAAAYHAGLPNDQRERVQTEFQYDTLQVVVATVAFGMGVDKPAIRRVVHYGAPQTIEHYVQQCGRAGRDGDASECIAFVKPGDSNEARQLMLRDFSGEMTQSSRCEQMLKLNAELWAFLNDVSQCRRVRLLAHFGESPAQWQDSSDPPLGCCVVHKGEAVSCRHCDVCLAERGCSGSQLKVDFSKELGILLDCADATGGSMGSGAICQMAAGKPMPTRKRLESHRCFGAGKDRSFNWWKAFLPHAIRLGMLNEKAARLSNGLGYAAICVSEQGRRFQKEGDGRRFELSPVPEDLCPKADLPKAGSSPQKPQLISTNGFQLHLTTELQKLLYHRRQIWQRNLNIQGETLVSNATLKQMAELRPSTPDAALRRIDGLPETLRDGLLEDLVNEINTFCSDKQMALDFGESDGPPYKRQMSVPDSPAAKIARLDSLAFQASGAPAASSHVNAFFSPATAAMTSTTTGNIEDDSSAAWLPKRKSGTLVATSAGNTVRRLPFSIRKDSTAPATIAQGQSVSLRSSTQFEGAAQHVEGRHQQDAEMVAADQELNQAAEEFLVAWKNRFRYASAIEKRDSAAKLRRTAMDMRNATPPEPVPQPVDPSETESDKRPLSHLIAQEHHGVLHRATFNGGIPTAEPVAVKADNIPPCATSGLPAQAGVLPAYRANDAPSHITIAHAAMHPAQHNLVMTENAPPRAIASNSGVPPVQPVVVTGSEECGHDEYVDGEEEWEEWDEQKAAGAQKADAGVATSIAPCGVATEVVPVPHVAPAWQVPKAVAACGIATSTPSPHQGSDRGSPTNAAAGGAASMATALEQQYAPARGGAMNMTTCGITPGAPTMQQQLPATETLTGVDSSGVAAGIAGTVPEQASPQVHEDAGTQSVDAFQKFAAPASVEDDDDWESLLGL